MLTPRTQANGMLGCWRSLALPLGLLYSITGVVNSQAGTRLSEMWAVGLDTTLVSPQSLVVTASCQIWILDRRTAVHRADCARREVLHVGRSGQGPGEYSAPWAMGLHHKDSIVVWDRNLRRATVFSTHGEVAKSVRVNLDPNREGQVSGLVIEGNAALVWTDNYPAGIPRPDEQRSFVWHIDLNTGVKDSLLSTEGPRSIIIRDGRTSSRINAPFSPRPWVLFLASGDFVLFSTGNDTARQYTRSGVEVGRFALGLPELRIDAADRRRFIESSREAYFGELAQQQYGPDLRDFFAHRWDELQDKMVFPASHPLFEQALASDDAQFWILRSTRGESRDRTWNRYSLSGRPAPAVLVPHRGDVLAAAVRQGVLFTVESDAKRARFWLVAYSRAEP